MQDLTPEGLETVQNLARNYSMSVDAVTTLLRALIAGNGHQAQFSHPELGGMGQWSQGGMIMIGDMFNNNLKATVSSLADALSSALRNQQMFKPVIVASNTSFFAGGSSQWPAELGSPSSSGSQNDMQYAFFPEKRRLAIRYGGATTVYDTGDHNIYGFGQQQGGDQSLTFNSQYGVVRVADLPKVQMQQGSIQQSGAQTTSFSSSNASFSPAPPFEPAPQAQAFVPAFDNSFPSALAVSQPVAAATTHDEIFQILEKLAGLRDKKILSDAEFESKKAELLSRL